MPGEIPDVVTGEVISSDWGNDIRDRTVQRYATVAARSAAIPTPVEGDLSYLEDSNTVWVYDGSAWVKVLQTPIVTADITDLNVTAGKIAAAAIAPFIHFDTVVSNTSGALTTTLTNIALITLNLSGLGWTTAKVVAWGTVGAVPSNPSSPLGTLGVRVVIDGSNGTEAQGPTGSAVVAVHSVSAAHGATANGATADISIQAREIGDGLDWETVVLSMLAVRLT